MKDFFKLFATGALIGIAMIIPGVSGGTLAVLMGVYDRLIGAISDLRRDFKKNIVFLLPIIFGAVVGIAAMYFPLYYALKYEKLPTILLFTGLMAGSMPKLFKDSIKRGFKPTDIVSFLIPVAVVVGICFIPSLGDVNLGADMPVGGYFLLIIMGALASCALVVPGVSGSLLMFIFGYYQPILDTVRAIFGNFWHSFGVLALFAIGLIVGFFSIAKLMKFFMNKFPRGTGWAINGFVLGSIPAILLTDEFASSTFDALNISIGVILCLFGAIATYALTAYVESKTKKQDIIEEN